METLAIKEASRLVEMGAVGVFLLIALGVIVYLYKELKASHEARLAEAMKFAASREDMAKALNSNTFALEGNNRAMEMRTRATEAVERAVSELAAETNNRDERLLERLTEIKKLCEQGIARAEQISTTMASLPHGRRS